MTDETVEKITFMIENRAEGLLGDTNPDYEGCRSLALEIIKELTNDENIISDIGAALDSLAALIEWKEKVTFSNEADEDERVLDMAERALVKLKSRSQP